MPRRAAGRSASVAACVDTARSARLAQRLALALTLTSPNPNDNPNPNPNQAHTAAVQMLLHAFERHGDDSTSQVSE